MKMTLGSVRRRLFLIPFAAAALTVGCGDRNILQSPTGPSGAPGSGAFLTGDAADAATASSADTFGTLAKGGNGKKPSDTDEPGQGKKPEDAGNPGRSHEDRVVGFVSAVFADTLTVNGITVVAGTSTVIRHGNRSLTMADIAVGDHVQARGAMEGTTLVAVEIKVQDTGNDNGDGGVEADLRGAVSGLTGTCPVVTFMIGATKVTTSAATVFDDVTCATLANLAIVEVEGATQADGSILATKVEAEAGPDEVEGTVSLLSGTCPTLTFKVGAAATTVNTTATTIFTGVACTALANLALVEVEGTKQLDGSITAASVELH